MKDLKIISEYDAIIQINDKKFELDDSNFALISSPDYEFNVSVYPITHKHNLNIPFSFKVRNNSTDKENISTFSLPLYDVMILENEQVQDSYVIKTLKLTSGDIKVKLSKKNIIFESKDSGITIPYINQFNDYDIGSIQDIAYVRLHGDDKDIYFYFPSENRIKKLSGKEITIENNTIKIKKSCLDLNKSIRNITYKIEGENFTKESDEFMSKEIDLKTMPTEILPMAFLEAIKISNYKTAKQYLSEALSEKLSENHLKKFFIKFNKIKILEVDKNKQQALVIGKDGYKLYEFEMDERIKNITEI